MANLTGITANQINIIVACCAAVSALAALASVFFAYRTINASIRQKETEIFLVFRRRYNDPEMKEALRELAIAYQNDENFFDEWIFNLISGDQQVEQLDNHRRVIKSYFVDISRMYNHRYIPKSLADVLLNVGGLNIFNKVVKPMEIKINPESWPKKDFDNVNAIRQMYGYGEIFRPRGTN